MSLLRTPSKTAQPISCSCQDHAATGTFSLKIEPRTVDVRETPSESNMAQVVRSQQLQELFFPNMGDVQVHEHDDGFHAHPLHDQKVAHLSQLHDMLDDNNLIARVQITPSAEHAATAVALTRDHVDSLVEKGTVDLKVPMHDNMFRLHSTTEGRITAVEYV